MESITRIPPHDTEAERAALSCMLSDGEALITSSEILIPSDFYHAGHRELFAVMLHMQSKNTPVDIVTLTDKLREKNLLEQVGGMEYLSTLVGLFFSSANIKQYNNIIAEKALLRRLAQAGTEIADSSYGAFEEAAVLLDKAEAAILNVSKNRNTSDFLHVRDCLTAAIDTIEKTAINKGETYGVPTGFTDIDYKTTGFKPSNLVLIAARPSMGKTALMLNIAEHAATRKNITTAFFALEMSREETASRMLCSLASLDSQKLRSGDMRHDDWSKLAEAAGILSESPIYFDDTPGISPSLIRAKCRKLKRDKNLGLIIIDYLQLMETSSKNDSRQQEISEISRQLKSVARELEVPVIVGSQLSRACEQRADHRPILSDLRESGAIEQDADIVAFIYRDEYYHPETEKTNRAEIIIAKQRNGPTGTVELSWMPTFAKFGSLAYGGN